MMNVCPASKACLNSHSFAPIVQMCRNGSLNALKSQRSADSIRDSFSIEYDSHLLQRIQRNVSPASVNTAAGLPPIRGWTLRPFAVKSSYSSLVRIAQKPSPEHCSHQQMTPYWNPF